MERRGEMDVAGPASTAHPLRATTVIILILACCIGSHAQSVTDRAKELTDQKRWQDLVALLSKQHEQSADLEYYYGSALAHLERWPEAQAAFGAGRRLQPRDKRFPLELAGVAFKQKKYSRAGGYARIAVHLDPSDNYSNDFLGTIYFLQGNLEAALKYWNRVNKPQLQQVLTEPELQVDPALLDRALAFSPASMLTAPELLTSDVRVRGLGIFPTYRVDLQARADAKFDVVLRARERDGWGSNKWEALLLLLRGLPFETLYPEFYNFHRQAINVTSLFRWDPEKRRVMANVSAPLEGNPKRSYNLLLDLRSENWDIRHSFTGASPLLGSFNLRRESLSGDIVSYQSGRWQWSAGGELSHRDFRSVILGPALTRTLLSRGYQLKQITTLNVSAWRIPERRFTLDAGASSQVGRIWSNPQHTFFKLQGSAHLHWLPQSVGDDYEVQHLLRAGKTFGDVPFDELYILGLERDNYLLMRAHIGTRDGRKGSAPLGRSYFLSNWEVDKNVYSNGLFTAKAGPFVDTGRITDPEAGLGSHQWLWDVGAQAKLKVLGVGVAFTYGKDLRTGNNAFYATLLR
jgi:tetratricopeptide (TPR) repeat protein